MILKNPFHTFSVGISRSPTIRIVALAGKYLSHGDTRTQAFAVVDGRAALAPAASS
jgi:hypothetical protein